ncbi:hypothetical protein [Lignipirellula cremea]|uniref:CARDB domain-containing protein n=1 Tax=Lignipirellula cremea TaxID=2528010 RepID=A0A518DSZ4_9BACT|nr:hypothetical protein [Lignipirellula cremea]QDU94957.1 hypothetical protein Pla8534_27660 [Lignipirellula cremea]
MLKRILLPTLFTTGLMTLACGVSALAQGGGNGPNPQSLGVQTRVQVQQGVAPVSQIGIRQGQRFDCRHVIDLLLRKNHWERFGGGVVSGAPVIVHDYFGDHVLRPELGDLQLVSLAMIRDGGPDAAPLYAVTIFNNSKVDLIGFRVSLVAVLGQIDEFAPTTTVRVDKLCAGATHTLEIGLPFASMAMGDANERCPFDTVVAAVDAFDEYAECNELNNLAIFKRCEIALVETTIEAGQSVGPGPNGSLSGGTFQNGPIPNGQAPPPASPSGPPQGNGGVNPGMPPGSGSGPPASPGIDFDRLDSSVQDRDQTLAPGQQPQQGPAQGPPQAGPADPNPPQDNSPPGPEADGDTDLSALPFQGGRIEATGLLNQGFGY